MSNDGAEEKIIFIRKRRTDDDSDHHGGVWKLAFADFMTAMMAFFLVMWLINSTSKETKAAIVQYFNPIQLIDANPAHKGLRDPKVTGQGNSVQQTNEDAPREGAGSNQQQREAQEAALHKEPMKALEEIAKRNAPMGAAAAAASASSGKYPPSFHDPFDRDEQSVRTPTERNLEEIAIESKPPQPDSSDDAEAKAFQEGQSPPRRETSAAAKSQSGAPATPGDEKAKTRSASLAAMKAALEKIIQSEVAGSQRVPHVEAVQTDEGLLISLMDDANFSMFSIGSIEPKPQLVSILAQIGQLLAKQPGDIELRGHTDGRSYKTAAYDNWRLSSDRANVAHYMLMRGGLAETRTTKIIGFAERRLKAPNDPLAAVNRRIEILIRGDHH